MRATEYSLKLAVITGLFLGLLSSTPIQAAELVDGPEDQEGFAGQDVTFSLEPNFVGLRYQWIRQWPDRYEALEGETNRTLVITNIDIADVGRFLCRVTHGDRLEFTDSAGLFLVSTVSSPSSPKTVSGASALSSEGMALMESSGGDSMVVYGSPVLSSGGSGDCPGPYAGYVVYKKSVAAGWGYVPSSSSTVHVAQDLTRTDTKVEHIGRWGDSGCGLSSTSVSHPPPSPKYRFTIYFPSDVPTTNAYPIFLEGFDP